MKKDSHVFPSVLPRMSRTFHKMKRVLAVPAGSDHGSVRFPESGRSSARARNAGKTGEPPPGSPIDPLRTKLPGKRGLRARAPPGGCSTFQWHLKRGLSDGGG
ncbi:hypothetical protein CEXT_644131 [Caerostris extrusa]|uniref:Uncharacterized protein n=1 Tax=Caerostris extrusa TaxID=172846 RepID=A0AAV4TZ60_CAEEX|nr:hypothetical protein CEXT_644131 [Caerostris extrusa]